MSIYSIFYKKLPHSFDELLPSQKGLTITFLNPYYIELLKDKYFMYEDFDYICSDGMFPIILNKIWGKSKSIRISFDMTSLAKMVFEYLAKSGLSIFFLGSSQLCIDKFIRVIKTNYKTLNIAGWHHGYIKNEFDFMVAYIIASGAEVVVIGMGAPLQDEFAIYLRRKGFLGNIYTCGGFFHQTTEKINYYPSWVNNWNLRTFYRLIHERYVWGRVLRYYPRFMINYSLFLIKSHQAKFNMEISYKHSDTRKIISYIQSSPNKINVEDIIQDSGADKLRVYPALFELEQEGFIEVLEREELGAPTVVCKRRDSSTSLE